MCRQDSSSLTLVGCLLAEKGIDYTTLHLNDANCTGQMDENKIVTFSFNSTNTCGAVVTVSAVPYKPLVKVEILWLALHQILSSFMVMALCTCRPTTATLSTQTPFLGTTALLVLSLAKTKSTLNSPASTLNLKIKLFPSELQKS